MRFPTDSFVTALVIIVLILLILYLVGVRVHIAGA